MLSLRRCHFPRRWQQWIGRNITTNTYRSHHAIPVRSAGAAAPHVSSWPTIQLPRAIGERCMSSSFHSVRVAIDISGVGLTWKNLQQRNCKFTLQHPSSSRWNSSSQHASVPRMSDCETLEEAIEVAYDHLDILSPRDMAAFWTVVPQFLQNWDRRPSNKHDPDHGQQQMHHQFDTILAHTMKRSEAFEYRDLAQTTLGFAKIVKNVGGHGKRLPKGGPHKILRNIFMGDNSRNKEITFRRMAEASIPILSEFDPPHLSNLIFAYGLAEYIPKFEDGTFFDILALEAMPSLKKFNSHDLSNMLWAYANVKASNPNLFKEAGDIIASLGLGNIVPQALSNTVWAYATLGESHPKLFMKVANHIMLNNFRNFNEEDYANIVWSYATVDESHPKLFQKVAGHMMLNLRSFKPKNLSKIVWAYATANEQHPKLFKNIAEHIVSLDNLGEFKIQELSNIVWAYAAARESQPKLFRNVAGHIMLNDVRSLRSLRPQDLSNIVWAYATAKEVRPKLFREVADHIVASDNLRSFDPHHLSDIVWAYATAQRSHPKLFKEFADHIIAHDDLRSFDPQHLSNIVWAYATAKESHPELFKKVADHIVKLDNLRTFKPSDLSNIVWAYATAEEQYPKIFKEVADHVVSLDNLGGFIPQALSNIAWAYATANESQPKLFKKVADAAIKKETEFDSQSIANFLWAYATNGQINQHLFQSLAQRAAALVGECTSENLANIAWAGAVANAAAPSLFNDDFINTCLEQEDEFTLEALYQLHQWQLWQEELKSEINLPPSLREKCFLEAFLPTEPTPSALPDDVILELSSIGLQLEEEVLTHRGYPLDALVEVNGNKIGIEFDGTCHFVGRKPTGSTILKQRQITNLEGIRIVSVPYWEWDKLGKDRSKKQQYLRNLLGLDS